MSIEYYFKNRRASWQRYAKFHILIAPLTMGSIKKKMRIVDRLISSFNFVKELLSIFFVMAQFTKVR